MKDVLLSLFSFYLPLSLSTREQTFIKHNNSFFKGIKEELRNISVMHPLREVNMPMYKCFCIKMFLSL